VLSLKRSTAGVVPSRVLSRKNVREDNDCVVLAFVPLRGEKSFSHTHKARSWYLLGALFKISEEHPRPFYMSLTWSKPPLPLVTEGCM